MRFVTKAMNGARGNAATNMVTKPYCNAVMSYFYEKMKFHVPSILAWRVQAHLSIRAVT